MKSKKDSVEVRTHLTERDEMKKSKLALIYGLSCLLFPLILLAVIRFSGAPKSDYTDGIDFSRIALFLTLLACSASLALVATILVVKARAKNNPNLILIALLFTVMLTIVYLAYPPYLFMPIHLDILG